MKLAFWQHLAVLTVLGLGATNFNSAALAAQFEQQEIDQSRFIVLAAPGGDIGYKLLILEQINSNRPCWSETGSNPSSVDPLLLNFDFTGICNRLVDSNSFSVRTAGEDQALQYSLRIIKQGNDLVLVAASNTDRNALVEIGRTNGIPTGFSRIVLNPGWRLTRRAFNGRALGHVYLTYDQPIEVLVASSRRNVPLGNPLPTTIPNTLPDLDSTDLDSADLDSADSNNTETLNTPPDAATPDVTPTTPRPADTSPADASVIPVPSLPPAISPTPAPDRTTPAPLPPLGTRPTTPPRTGTAPNLSTILPRPSATPNATTNPSATQTPAQPTQSSNAVQPGTSGTNDTPILPPPPPVLTAPAPGAGSTSTGSTSTSSTSTGSTTSTSRTTSPPSSRTSSSASGRSTTAQPTGVPQVSNSGGAPLRPRSLRREEPPTSQAGQASSSASGSNSSSPTRSTRSTYSSTARNSATGGSSSGSSNSGSSATVAQTETYQVIVVADNAEAQDKVREIVPDAFLTTINGQVVMQAGVFQDRQEADQLQQRLSLEGLSTAVISVR